MCCAADSNKTICFMLTLNLIINGRGEHVGLIINERKRDDWTDDGQAFERRVLVSGRDPGACPSAGDENSNTEGGLRETCSEISESTWGWKKPCMTCGRTNVHKRERWGRKNMYC